MNSRLLALVALFTAWPDHFLQAADTNLFPVTIKIHAGKPIGELKPIWRFFGADEPNYATMPNGKKLIGELGALRPMKFFSARTIC